MQSITQKALRKHSVNVMRQGAISVNQSMLFNQEQKQYSQLSKNNQVNVKSVMNSVLPMRKFSSLPDHLKLEMPNLSPTMEKGNIVSWHKQVGDTIAPGDILASIETDKATIDFEMQEEGYIAKLMFPEGAKDVELGTPIAIIVDDEDDIPAFKDYTNDASGSGSDAKPEVATPQQETVQQPQAVQQSTQQASPVQHSGDRLFVSPLAKKTAAEQGKDLSQIQGSGPNGRIIKADVDSHVHQQQAQATTSKPSIPQVSQDDLPEFVDLENSNIRKVIAERLSYSKQNIPHYYVTYSVEVDSMLKLRQRLNKVSESKISVNDLVIKAASLAATRVPETNSSWQGDYVRQYKNVNMAVAVQTDHGLMAPVIQNTNLKGLSEISSSVKEVAGRARENKLKPEELSGGTFTISNMGMYGVHNFSAIINPPQACILAVSGSEQRVVPNDGEDKDTNPFKVVHMMNVTLSSDHRVVDGAIAAAWGLEFKKFIEKPELMLL